MLNCEPFDLDKIPDSTLLDTNQAAQALTVSEGTLSVWRCTGRYNLQFVKIGRLVRYRASDLKKFVARRIVGADAA